MPPLLMLIFDFSQEEPLAVNHLRRIGIIHVWSTRFACFLSLF